MLRRVAVVAIACIGGAGCVDTGESGVVNAAMTCIEWEVEAYLERGTSADERDGFGRTPLSAAAAGPTMQCERTLELLLAAGADPNLRDDAGRTAVVWATLEGSAANLEILVRGGADACTIVSLDPVPGYSGRTAIDVARDRGADEVVDLALRLTQQCEAPT